MEYMLMPLKRYAQFSGRSRRLEFWLWFLAMFVINIVFAILIITAIGGSALFSNPEDVAGNMAMMFAGAGAVLLISGIVSLALLLPSLAVTVRRLHDSDKSGWWIMVFWGPYLISMIFSGIGAALADNGMAFIIIGGLFNFVFLIGCVAMLVLCLLDGTRGPNRYGDDPKRPSSAEIFA